MYTLKTAVKEMILTLVLILTIILFIRLMAYAFLPKATYIPVEGIDASNVNLSDIKPNLVSAMVDKIAFCESSHVETAYVPNDGGSPSAGYLQFKHATFTHYWKLLVNKDVEEQEINNLWREKEHQVFLAEKMISHNSNNLRHWLNCSRSLGYISGKDVAPHVKLLLES